MIAVPRLKPLIHCSLSAAISYGVFVWEGRFVDAWIPETVVLLIPGLAFYLALHSSIGRSVSWAWRIFMAVILTAGWHFAYQSAAAIEAPLYFAGGVGGAIGGAALFVALLSHPQRRTLANAALFTIAGAVIGALCLPAGFLFGVPNNFDYLFLTFFPWQIGMGLIVTDPWLAGRYNK